jgi:acyl-CoA synthetase (AMP-forming)/AMP-acid ligase II
VHPGEVEDVLLRAATVADAAVVGVPDDRLGEVPWAFVVPADSDTTGQTIDPEELAALCRQHLAPYKVPVGFETIGALPRNEVGKVLKRVLSDRVVTR